MHEDIENAGMTVVGISPQGNTSHNAFSDQMMLPFLLLSDERKSAIKAYGVDGPFGLGVRRVTYLVGYDGVIRDRLIADFMVSKHIEFIKRLARDEPTDSV